MRNDYMIDRELQKTLSYTGISGVSDQDAAIQDSQGAIQDRTREHLGPTDVGIIEFRKLLMAAARALQQIQNQIEEIEEAELIDALATEVEAAVGKLQGLEPQVREQEQALLMQLLKVIRGDDLRALNRVRKVRNQAATTEPSPATTYGKTKAAYEAFNGAVRTEGQGYFENAGKKTHWSLWVEICSALAAANYAEDQHPDHADAIRELASSVQLVRTAG